MPANHSSDRIGPRVPARVSSQPTRSRTGRPDRRFGRASTDRSRAQALVEFALILPLLLLFLLGAIDAGRLFFSYVQVSNASREAASYGVVYPNDTATMTTRAMREANVQGQAGESTLVVAAVCANSAGTTIACVDAAGGGGAGNTVTVNVTEHFSFLTPLINTFFGGGLDIKAASTAAVLGLAPNGGSTPPSGCAPPTSAAFTVTVSTFDVTLDATAATPNSGACAIASYDWDMGDGLDPFPPSSAGQSGYTYAGAQIYAITLTVSNPGGTLVSTQFIPVGPGATPSPTPTPTPTPTATPTAAPTPTAPVCNFVPDFTLAKSLRKQVRSTSMDPTAASQCQSPGRWDYGDNDFGYGAGHSKTPTTCTGTRVARTWS